MALRKLSGKLPRCNHRVVRSYPCHHWLSACTYLHTLIQLGGTCDLLFRQKFEDVFQDKSLNLCTILPHVSRRCFKDIFQSASLLEKSRNKMGENIIESIDLEIKESAVNCRKWVIA